MNPPFANPFMIYVHKPWPLAPPTGVNNRPWYAMYQNKKRKKKKT